MKVNFSVETIYTQYITKVSSDVVYFKSIHINRKCQESSKEGSIGNKQMHPSCKEENENK